MVMKCDFRFVRLKTSTFRLLNLKIYRIQNFAMVNRIWPTAVAGKADNVSSMSASTYHIGRPNSVNPGQILLDYGSV